MKGMFLLPWCGVAGLLYAAGFAPLAWYPAPPIALALLFLLLRTMSVRFAVLGGTLFGLAATASGMRWLLNALDQPDLVDRQGMLLPGIVLVLLAQALPYGFGAGFFALAGRWVAGASLPLLFACAWVLAEVVCQSGLLGLPLLLSAHAMVGTPFDGYAAPGGGLFVGFTVALAAASLGGFVTGPSRWPPAMVLVTLLAGGALLQHAQWTLPEGDSLRVRVVHGDLRQAARVERHRVLYAVRKYLVFSRAEPLPDLVVWPEGALGYDTDHLHEHVVPIARQLRTRSVHLLVGAYLEGDAGWANSLLDAAVPWHSYRKRALIPVAERRIDWLGRAFGALRLPMDQLVPGPDRQAYLRVRGVALASAICFEALFPFLLHGDWVNTGFSVLVSDLAWFESRAGAAQMLRAARMRALEGGRPLVHASNRGISAVIDHRGRVEVQLAGTFSYRDLVVQPRGGATPFARWGPLASVCCILLAGLLHVVMQCALARSARIFARRHASPRD